MAGYRMRTPGSDRWFRRPRGDLAENCRLRFAAFLPAAVPERVGRVRANRHVAGVIGIFYGAWMAFAQTDIKRLIAYTSVSHMGFVLIAIYTGSQLAYRGAVIQMIAHGLSAAGLFILCGQLYERIHTRDMRMMGGLWSKMKWLPALSLFFAVATLGMRAPVTSSANL